MENDDCRKELAFLLSNAHELERDGFAELAAQLRRQAERLIARLVEEPARPFRVPARFDRMIV